MCLQGTRKIRCMAHIEVKAFNLYPEYMVKIKGQKIFTNVVILIILLVNLQLVAFSGGPHIFGNVYCRYRRN